MYFVLTVYQSLIHAGNGEGRNLMIACYARIGHLFRRYAVHPLAITVLMALMAIRNTDQDTSKEICWRLQNFRFGYKSCGIR